MLSRVVCFVCGSAGGICQLRIHARENGPYFPFLETHDPPKGARIPGNTGVVDSCRVCFAFLNQQWDSYEKSKTPSVKRLYWLKRVDNGMFTGAEMRLQGEYAAQVMGLQYQPSGSGTLSPYEYAGMVSNTSNSSPNSSRKGLISPGGSSFISSRPNLINDENTADSDGALDLSVTNSNETSLATLENMTQLKAMKNKESLLQADAGLRMVEGPTMVCYICSRKYPSSLGRFIYAKKHTNDEPYFPFLMSTPSPKEAMPLTKHGLTRACSNCRKTLCRQWRFFDSNNVPEDQRVYQIDDKPLPFQPNANRNTDSLNSNRLSELELDYRQCVDDVCYLCAQGIQKSTGKLLYTKQPDSQSNHSMFFPFLEHHQPASGAKPVDTEGRVVTCRACYSYLQRQWQHYQSEGVAIQKRKFLLRPLNGSSHVLPSAATLPPGSQTGIAVSAPSQPLNIEISSQSSVSTPSISMASMPSSPAGFSPNPSGLLAIATPRQPQLLMPGVSYLYPQLSGSLAAPIMSEKIAPASDFSHQSNSFEKSTEKTGNRMRGIDARTSDQPSNKMKKCVVCGMKSDRLTILQAHPLKQEPGEKSGTGPTWPFFPFLTNPAYGGLSSIAKDGTVTSCFPCYYSLHQQWAIFEESSNIEEQNRWLRKYKTKTFICYTCGKETKRQNLCEVHLNVFPFVSDLLRELPRLKTAVYVENEGVLLTCSGCLVRLRSHREQMKREALGGHKSKSGSVEEGGSSSSESLRSSSVEVSSGDDRSSHTPAAGIPAGAKPPPLTMVNSITRTTATVPPLLNQTSPNSTISASSNVALNATRASSFAAALRKLAKQAGDPETHESGPEPLSVTSNSPRDPSKRAPPLPVYPVQDQGTSSITSPPVVTIAPTPAHPGFLNSDNVRKSLDRPGTTSSHGSMMIDPLGIKQEGERRPTSHERREEDRPRSKDSASQRLPAHSVMSNMAVTSVVGSHEDHLARGFQPYRPGDDSLGRTPYGHYPGLDPMYSAAAAAAAYHTAFQPAHPFSHPAFRFDDPLLLERYRLMQASPLGFPYSHPGMLPPGLHPLLQGGSRYPPEVLAAQHMPFLSSANHISPAHSVERQKSEEEIRREREKEVEKERERERQREREREREREQELERQREKERESKEREERERREQELREKERQERERHERERHEREKASRCKRVHQDSRYNSLYAPNSRNSIFSAEKLIGASSHQSSEPLNLNKRDNDRHKQSSVDRERERQFMHSQFLREQENLLREQERQNSDNREHYRDSRTSAALTLTIPKVPSLEMGSHPRVSESHSFHRPFERTLTNGYERDHFTDYERRLMTERILAQDRKVLPAESHGRVSSGSGKAEHQDLIRDSVLVSSVAEKPHLHEGIQSRLLESEKPKLKPVHGAVRSLNQYDYDRPQPEFNFQLKHSSEEKERLDNNSGQPDRPVAPQSHQLSKLDLEEMRLRRARANGEYNSDASEEEEGEEELDPDEDKRQRLMVIPVGLPAKLDASPKKMKFLSQFGLTTQTKCSDVIFEQQCKRRRLYHEPSISPTEVEAEETPTSQSSPLTTHINPDDLNRSANYKAKARFLYSLGLEPVPVERRQYWDMIRQICDWDKRRRLGVKGPPPPLQPMENNIYTTKSLAKPSLQGHMSPHKRKYSDMEGSQGRSPSRSVTDSPKITLGQLAARHSSQPQGKTPSLAKVDSRHMGHSEGRKEDQQSACNREFAQEFHESVLQTTRQQQEKNAPQSQEPRYRLGKSNVSIVSNDIKSSNHVSPPISSRVPSVPIYVRPEPNPSAPAPLIEGSKCRSDVEPLRWPGIEAVMEAYQRHAEEQKLERQVLLDQCQSLQYQNRELNRSAERLSMCMSDLIQKKQHAEEERLCRQTSIDNLKKCLKFLR